MSQVRTAKELASGTEVGGGKETDRGVDKGKEGEEVGEVGCIGGGVG